MLLTEATRWRKRTIVFSADIFMTAAAWLIAGWLAMDVQVNTFFLAALITTIQGAVYISCGLYRGIWRFASIPDLIRIIRSVLIGTTILIIVSKLQGIILPFKICILYAFLLIILLASPRLLFRWLRDYRKPFKKGKRVLVVGAGSAGEGMIRDLCRLPNKYQAIGFVDDDPNRLGCEVHGVRVLGTCAEIPILAKAYQVELIFLAIPSASSHRMREIVHYCEQTKLPFRTLPGLKDIADGTVTLNSLREVLLEDLLGREQVDLDWEEIKSSIHHKSILITGGGGSIGSELCRQIAQLHPAKITIIDNNEFNLYSIDLELRNKYSNVNVSSHLCSVTDKVELKKLFASYKPELVFHVAAYKHVPLLETHLRVSMYNNIIGTRTVAELADHFKVRSFVLISTDKAVNPSNIMGATKRAAEVFCQNLNRFSQTQFITVRFGNVLGSNGSVVPLFRQQLLEGGPITLTHKDITRYFMTIPEATQLILQANTIKNHGEIFVLDMGEPIQIRYLAEQMIKLSGKVINEDIEIKYIGLRPGEKLYEELFHSSEEITATSHPKIKQARVRYFDWKELTNYFNQIEKNCTLGDESQLEELLKAVVPEYAKANAAHVCDAILCANEV